MIRSIAGVALKIGDQRLDEDLRVAPLDLADRLGEVLGTAVREVVAVDRREHDVVEPDLGDRVRDVLGLVRVERLHPARLHVTEVTPARAAVTHEHERRGAGAVPAGPALAHVGAVCLLTHRVEVALAEAFLDLREPGPGRGRDFSQSGFRRPRCIPEPRRPSAKT